MPVDVNQQVSTRIEAEFKAKYPQAARSIERLGTKYNGQLRPTSYGQTYAAPTSDYNNLPTWDLLGTSSGAATYPAPIWHSGQHGQTMQVLSRFIFIKEHAHTDVRIDFGGRVKNNVLGINQPSEWAHTTEWFCQITDVGDYKGDCDPDNGSGKTGWYMGRQSHMLPEVVGASYTVSDFSIQRYFPIDPNANINTQGAAPDFRIHPGVYGVELWTRVWSNYTNVQVEVDRTRMYLSEVAPVPPEYDTQISWDAIGWTKPNVMIP